MTVKFSAFPMNKLFNSINHGACLEWTGVFRLSRIFEGFSVDTVIVVALDTDTALVSVAM